MTSFVHDIIECFLTPGTTFSPYDVMSHTVPVQKHNPRKSENTFFVTYNNASVPKSPLKVPLEPLNRVTSPKLPLPHLQLAFKERSQIPSQRLRGILKSRNPNFLDDPVFTPRAVSSATGTKLGPTCAKTLDFGA